tara:strand:+ start:3314 stop:3811 length:498 start_codon:yes stop_codon:yes gene_type:complete
MKKAFVFDFDDTLATTDCKVLVRSTINPSIVGKRLTPAEFNDYKLTKFTQFDFSEFQSEEFIHNANPTKLMALAKEVYDEGHAVYVLTARLDNVAKAVTSWLLGLNIKPLFVFGVGSDDIAEEKQKVLATLNQIFDVVYLYDDDQNQLYLANFEQSQVGVKAYLV